jgi:hypothetical protein
MKTEAEIRERLAGYAARAVSLRRERDWHWRNPDSAVAQIDYEKLGGDLGRICEELNWVLGPPENAAKT